MNKSTLKLSVSFLLILFLVACQNEKELPPITEVEGRLYTYADGSGNIYSLIANRIKYDPVTVVNSSSGTYSGGEHVDKTIDEKAFLEVIAMLNSAVADTSLHIDKRTKGSGVIVITGAKQKRVKCILSPKDASKEKIESTLKKLIK